jgi:UTP--glucose-1-phosphate uridylyltransferase
LPFDPGAVHGNATELKGVVEKPAAGIEPSNLCVIGRYVLQPENFGILDTQECGAGNEIQLTDAMAKMIGKTSFHADKTDCARYDCGDKVGFLHADIAVGLSRPDIEPALRAILTDIGL